MEFLEKHKGEHTISTLGARPSISDRNNKINEIIGKLNDVLALLASDETKL